MARRTTSCRLIRGVSDQWTPFTAPRSREPLLEHVRTLWTLQGIQSQCTAAIYRNDFGLELRVELAGELIESRLSRFGEGPLLLIAEQANLTTTEAVVAASIQHARGYRHKRIYRIGPPHCWLKDLTSA